MQSCNYFPLISRPTRFPDNNSTASPSLLDHIWTIFTVPSSPGILLFPLSDHLPVYLNLPTLDKPLENHIISFRLKNQENCTKFTTKLSAVHWNSLLSHQFNCNLFLDTIHSIYFTSFPKVTKLISTKRLQKPWITQGIIKAIYQKFKLYKSYKLGIIEIDIYKQYRNHLTNLIKQSKKNYYLKKFSDFRLSTRKIWDTINELTNSNKTKTSPTNSVILNNNIMNSPYDISEAFNTYLQILLLNLPLSFLSGNYPHSMAMPPVTTHETIQVINALKNKEGHMDEIPVHIIKQNKDLFALPLTILFNQSVESGTFPERFKLAKIIPIHKTGCKSVLSNYRPISILSTFSKIFETLMKNQLILFLKQRNILNNRQFGFRPGLNTFDAVNTFMSDLYTSLNNHKSIISIFIDQ